MIARGRASDDFFAMTACVPRRKQRSTPSEDVSIPAHEAWLFRNEKALASVLCGLDQARRMDFADPPDLDEDEKLAAMIPD